LILLSSLNKSYYKPGEIAKILNCSVRTIQNYCDKNIFDSVIYQNNKFRLITKESLVEFLNKRNMLLDDSFSTKHDIIYARVSTNKQKNSGDLDRQVEKISTFAISKNPINLLIFKEVGSGLNDNRKQLLKIINMVENNEVNRIFILYKDRLTRFGFNYLNTLCKAHNVEIIVVSTEQNDKSIQEELAEDIISIIHSFSGKLYGLRKSVKTKIDEELEE